MIAVCWFVDPAIAMHVFLYIDGEHIQFHIYGKEMGMYRARSLSNRRLI